MFRNAREQQQIVKQTTREERRPLSSQKPLENTGKDGRPTDCPLDQKIAREIFSRDPLAQRWYFACHLHFLRLYILMMFFVSFITLDLQFFALCEKLSN